MKFKIKDKNLYNIEEDKENDSDKESLNNFSAEDIENFIQTESISQNNELNTDM